MANDSLFRIQIIDESSPYLQAVIKLGKAHKKRVGFLPDGAFRSYAQRRAILVALDEDGSCAGYILYRRSRGRLIIVHLCVSKSHERRGIARSLVNHLSEIKGDSIGIGIWCRRDYGLSGLWSDLGFVVYDHKKGRSHEGKLLEFWWKDVPNASLFSAVESICPEPRIAVVLDASVFFDLRAPESENTQESKALMSDWLHDLNLCLTHELRNEINRNMNADRRKSHLVFANKFHLISSDQREFEKAYDSLKKIFPAKTSAQDKSDLRQLAWTIASSDAQFFVTRDRWMIENAGEISREFGISVMRPSDLIVKLDEIERASEYQPGRFSGTAMTMRRVRSGEEHTIADTFLSYASGERKPYFLQRIGGILAQPRKHSCCLILDSNRNQLALLAYNWNHGKILEVPLLRIVDTGLSNILASHLTLLLLRAASKEGRVLTVVSDPHLGDPVLSAMQRDGFTQVLDGWAKPCLRMAESANIIAEVLHKLSEELGGNYPHFGSIASAIQDKAFPDRAADVIRLERLLWPLKVTDAKVNCFIIPIQPRWAQELVDQRLAAQTLFGADIELTFNREGVYYRSARPGGGLEPGRVLWYVTKNKKYRESACIRACSHIEEVAVGKPKDLYRRFRRLGVYQWKNVLEVAKKKASNDIMAVRFTDTQWLDRPIPWAKIQGILRSEGCPSTLQSPHPIPKEVFAEIYKLGGVSDE
ncbi:MAG: GNAT family N-acetyltransferase [Planctomycetota bacterium]